jgi:FtsP/CotA-like multicopper oxidase with cupredoxin domain
MSERRSRHLVGVIIALVVAAVVFVGVVLLVRSSAGLGYEPPATASTTGAKLALSVFPDSFPCHGSTSGAPGGGAQSQWVTYCPSTSIRVPAYSTVTVTIKQYDTSTALHNPFFDQVRGTVGGVMLVNGRPMRQVSPDAPGHTFTIQTPPNAHETFLFVNVPLLGVSATAPNRVTIAGQPYPSPNVIVFKFKTGSPGQYVWHCYVPCGTGLSGLQEGFGGPMATTGYMAGTVTVT